MQGNVDVSKLTRKFIVFLLISFAFFVFYCMGQWLAPFLIALILAYALHAPTKQLAAKFKISQALSSGIFVLALISAFVFFMIFMVPLLKNTVLLLINKLPKIMSSLPALFDDSIQKFLNLLGISKTITLESELEKYFSTFTSDLPTYLFNFLNTGVTLVYIIMFAFMTPILTFYLLKDWNKIEEYSKKIIDRLSSKTAKNIFLNINSVLGQYVKGQLTICCLLSVFYCLGLCFIGTKEFIVCGLISGILAFAPFFGPLLGFITTLTMSIDDFNFSYQYLLLCCIYVTIPFLDSNFITPRLIGRKVGIHPFWILFSICATVSLLGTIGIFISVPVAVTLSTVCKEFAKKL